MSEKKNNWHAEHTAGPWIVYQPPGGALQIVPEDSGSLRICTVMQAHNEHANARLIAAAPESLEVLKRIRASCQAMLDGEDCDPYDMAEAIRDEADAVISKTTGGAQ